MADDHNGVPPLELEQQQKKHHTNLEIPDDDEENDSPIEQVRFTVPPTDNPSLPVLTCRTWILGIISCATLAFVNTFFGYRQNPLSIGSVAAQIVTLPLGKLMASALPDKQIGFGNFSFNLNPGPFNIKEHVLITIFANCGANGVYALNIVTSVKAFYHRELNFWAAYLLCQTTMLLGYGWAGMHRNVLVDSPYMWWPENLVQVSLFRTLHEKEKRKKGTLTRLQFFLMFFVASFAYYLVPGYFAPTISCISIACLIWKDSVLAHQLGSGLKGLGLGSFALDWNTAVSFLGNPISTPAFAIINILAGFGIFVYIVIPAAYWSNIYNATRFPLYSTKTFDVTGQKFNISRVLNEETFQFDDAGYRSYSKLYLSIFFAFSYGLSFATLTATLSHVGLFHAKTIWELTSKTTKTLKGKMGDVHTRLMKKNYKAVPAWWFHAMLVLVFGLSLLCCEGFGKQLQLPWWGLIMACGIAWFFTLPIGLIQATTNQQPGLNVITELIIGFIYPGRPLANVSFKTYGYISMTQALMFLSDFKVGHYMKIPPRSMFFVQLVGTLVSSSIQFLTGWWLLTSIKNICDPSLLPEGSPWTCPGDEVFYNASIIWGVIGPNKMFTKHGNYPQLNYFFLIGALLPVPVWLLSRKFPDKKWIQLINMPIILGATSTMPPARSVNFITWGAIGLVFNVYIYRKYKAWWARHAYILGAALNAGIAFMGILLYFSLNAYDISGPVWWGMETTDYCPLATCPTEPGVKVEGCPVF
ncbi:OLC1v1022447C1 [Oldenlandia corymbosa var. corymbosa]|uniref:OLC1v1022447C1 n=1 Tax=Oldenlandia corymbosa var. corymbosa TaxID=529605 RepID=A0AAV1BZ70_OLDCO|nr:OLC1v1022447C1 [Oldenlandia corymbosa var. corymbosa]